MDVMLRLQFRQARQELIETAEWTPLIAGDERGDTTPRARIAFVLFDDLSCDGLYSGEQNGPRRGLVSLVQEARWLGRLEICQRDPPPRYWYVVVRLLIQKYSQGCPRSDFRSTNDLATDL
jgi:hypothetical protein